MGVARQGFRAAVEFVHSFSFSTVHIYLRKNLDTHKNGPFCIILCVFGRDERVQHYLYLYLLTI